MFVTLTLQYMKTLYKIILHIIIEAETRATENRRVYRKYCMHTSTCFLTNFNFICSNPPPPHTALHL